MEEAAHTFHIPVMGLAFTIDTPIKVARFGISSVVSIMEDNLIEKMRKHYAGKYNYDFNPIHRSEPDSRSKRITSYLNLINDIVNHQVEKMKKEDFCPGSDLTKYFEMLPPCDIKARYDELQSTTDTALRELIASELKDKIVKGSIDVNIMTKPDREYSKNGRTEENCSDAVSSLRGYIESDLCNSSVIFSAGFNPRLYNYLAQFSDHFLPGISKRKIVIKVSDYRSALIQGKYLAKKGILVNEFRIESGLNCGGHAFATNGYLMGPILEEFRNNKHELENELFQLYLSTGKKGTSAPTLKITAQGGIGTADENEMLLTCFNVDSTGWGTPFLLVPEATAVDDETLELLSKSRNENLLLSKSSPLGVRFYYLKGTSGEKERLRRIADNKPGSPCTEKYLATNTEFTSEPICTASSKYQKLKIKELNSLFKGEELKSQTEAVTEKECLCIGLSNPAAINYEFSFSKNTKGVTVCPGPNIVNFSRVASLKEMIDHIYGRIDLVTNKNRNHMFIAELKLYIDYLTESISDESISNKSLVPFIENLTSGINYYKNIFAKGIIKSQMFLHDLLKLEERIDQSMELLTLKNI